MVNIDCIIAPTDFSSAADRATRRAASVASTLGSALHLVHVLPPHELLEQLFPADHRSEIEALRVRAEEAIEERARRLAGQFGITPTHKLAHGHAHEAILEAADTLGANLVVLGARGERDGAHPSAAVGETALKVAERSRVATLLVRREVREPYCCVVGCTSGVPGDRAVIMWAEALSPADLIHIVSAYGVPYERRLIEWGASQSTIDVYAARDRDERTRQLSELLDKFGLPAARARLHVERGDPLQTILSAIEREAADLVIIGRRARADALAASPVGSVARQVAFLAPMDVMIVPIPRT
jgi:nucleotide-binding universal stress UspA family protein